MGVVLVTSADHDLQRRTEIHAHDPQEYGAWSYAVVEGKGGRVVGEGSRKGSEDPVKHRSCRGLEELLCNVQLGCQLHSSR